jgi:hypothetical protein
MQYDVSVAVVCILITTIHPQVGSEFKIQWLPAKLSNTWWVGHGPVHYGTYTASSLLDPMKVEKAYGYCASHCHCLQWPVQSCWWCYANLSFEGDLIEGRLILHGHVCVAEDVQIVCWSNYNDWYASHFSTDHWSVWEVRIMYEVEHRNGYQFGECEFWYYPLPRGVSEVCGEQILFQTLTILHHETQQCSAQQSLPLYHGFWIWSICFRSI